MVNPIRLLFLAVFFEFLALAKGEDKIFSYSAYPDMSNNFAEASFACVLPAARPEGVLFLAGGTDSDSRPWLHDERWRSFAQKNRLALMATALRGAGQAYEVAGGGSGQALLDALKSFAHQSGRAEFATLPLVLYGHSAGAQFAFNFACWRPDRVQAIVCMKSGPLPEPTPAAKLSFPALFIVGEHDQAGRIREVARAFAAGRAQGARWTFAVQPDAGHGAEGCGELAELFIDAITTGAPAKGEFANLSGEPTKAVASENENKSSWLPDPVFAQAWRAFSKPVSLRQLLELPEDPPDLRISWQSVRPLSEKTGVSMSPTGFTYAASLPADKILSMEPGRLPPSVTAHTAQGSDGAWLLTGELDPSKLSVGPCKFQLPVRIRSASGKDLHAQLPMFTRITGPISVSPSSLYYGVLPRGQTQVFDFTVTASNGHAIESWRLESSDPAFLSADKPTSGGSSSAVVKCILKSGDRIGARNGKLTFIVNTGQPHRITVPFYGFIRK